MKEVKWSLEFIIRKRSYTPLIRIRIEGKGFWKRFLPVPGRTFKITSFLLWRLRLVCMWRLRSWATDEKSLDIYFSLSELKQEYKF